MLEKVDVIIDPDYLEEYQTKGLDYATEGSAGLDVRACIEEPILLEPGQVVLVSIGLKIHIGDPRYAALLMSRSGHGAKHRISLANSVGLLDSDYQGYIKAALANDKDEAFSIEPMERIGQLVFVPVERPELKLVTDFVASERGEGGFGHSGRQ